MQRRSLGALLWIALFLSSAAQAQWINPSAHWRFDEGSGSTAADDVSGNQATLVNTPEWSTGRVWGALAFFNNRYVAAGTLASLANVHQSGGLSISAWIKPASAGGGDGGRIVDKSNGGAGWMLKMSGAAAVQFVASEFATADVQGTSLPVIALSTWQHVVVTWDGSPSGAVNIYVNGNAATDTVTGGAGAPRDDSATPLAIGNRSLDAARGFDGLIDEVWIFPGVISSAQIQELADSSAPSRPAGLSATPVSSSQVNLTWTASTDNFGVAKYLVDRCTGVPCTFARIGEVTSGTSFGDSGLAGSTTYYYRVTAADANANLSLASFLASATTPAGGGGDTQAPTTPTGLTATAVSSTQIDLSWNASTDNVAVTGYLIERCSGTGCVNFAQIATPTGTTFNDTGRTSSTAYSYRVRAQDAVPNYSGYSSTASATTPAAGDTQAPSIPTNLSATAVSSTQINLSWTASTDNVGVTGYLVERCEGAGCSSFSQIATPTATTYDDTGRTASTSYSYRVRAQDAIPNYSAYSGTASATTQAAGDTQAPTAPTGLIATAGANQIALAWTASTDNVAVTGYLIERCQGAGCSGFAQIDTAAGTTYNDTMAVAGVSYSYRVRARDAVPNYSGYSSTVTAVPADCD